MSKPRSVEFTQLFNPEHIVFSRIEKDETTTEQAMIMLTRNLKDKTQSGCICLTVYRTTNAGCEPVLTRNFASMWIHKNSDGRAVINSDLNNSNDAAVFVQALRNIKSPTPVNEHLFGGCELEGVKVIREDSRTYGGSPVMKEVENAEDSEWSFQVIRQMLYDLAEAESANPAPVSTEKHTQKSGKKAAAPDEEKATPASREDKK